MAEVESLYQELPVRFKTHHAAITWKRVDALLAPPTEQVLLPWAMAEAAAMHIPMPDLVRTKDFLYDLADQ
jgi:hypothetical protein